MGEDDLNRSAIDIDLALTDAPHSKAAAAVDEPLARVRYCVPDDQMTLLPRSAALPTHLTGQAPLPRVGDVVYLAPRSAWGVQLVVFDWSARDSVTIEVWLQHIDITARRGGQFPVTQ